MYHPFRSAAHYEVKKKTMPNVADELAALPKGSVKARATNLTASGGAALSTPEAEAAALKAKSAKDKLGKIKAKEILNKGSSGAAQASHEQAAQFTAKKKEDLEKKAEASEILKKGGTGGGYSQQIEHTLSQTGKKKAEWEKKNEAKKIMNKGSSTSTKSAPLKSEGEKSSAPAPAIEKKSSEPETKVTNEGSPAQKKDTTRTVQKNAPTPPAPVEKKEAVPTPIETEAEDVPELEEVDDAIPELETPGATATQQKSVENATRESAEERQITNRNEKKARKMMTRLGLRPISNIARVTLKAGAGRGYFFIDSPDVYMALGGKQDTYVIFGEARQGANQQQAAMAAAQQQAAMAAASAGGGGGKGMGMASVLEEEENDDVAAVPELTEEGGNVTAGDDEDGIESKDIDLVMSQASCSRSRAVAALKENDGDLVNAIMSLTT